MEQLHLPNPAGFPSCTHIVWIYALLIYCASYARGRCVVYQLPLPVGVDGFGGSGCVCVLGPHSTCCGWGPRGYIRGGVCGVGPYPLRPPSKHSAITALCRVRRGSSQPHQLCVGGLDASSGVLPWDYRAQGTFAPLPAGGRAALPQACHVSALTASATAAKTTRSRRRLCDPKGFEFMTALKLRQGTRYPLPAWVAIYGQTKRRTAWFGRD